MSIGPAMWLGPHRAMARQMEFANIATPASLLGEPTRAAIVMLLCDNRAHPASEIAAAVGVSPQSASNHLRMLVEGGLLTMLRQGRHRYFSLSSPAVAQAVEALALTAATRPAVPVRRTAPPSRARRCYSHLAGELGVEVLRAMLDGGLLRRGSFTDTGRPTFDLTPQGRAWLANQEAAVSLLKAADSEGFAIGCLDCTERRFHLAGRLGSWLLARWLEEGTLQAARKGRALWLTPQGAQRLFTSLGIAASAADQGHVEAALDAIRVI